MNIIADRSGLRICKETILTRREVEGLIADGRNILVVDGEVLKVDAWLRYHPGGVKAIMHMVGRDATDEVNAYDTFQIYPRPFFANSLQLTDYTQRRLASTCRGFVLAGLMDDGEIFCRRSKAATSRGIPRTRVQSTVTTTTRWLPQAAVALFPLRQYLIQLRI